MGIGLGWSPAVATATFLCFSSLALADDWPQFRGPAGAGRSAASGVPNDWSDEQNLAWKATVPGAGWSQPVIQGNQVYVTTAVSETPVRPKGFMAGVIDPATRAGKSAQPPDQTFEWRVLAYDLTTGAPRWSQTIEAGRPQFAVHPSNTFATETPAADDAGVYVFFGATGTVAALTPQGQVRWRRELGTYRTMENFGTGSSPALHEGKLFVQCFNEEKAFAVCLDTTTGQEVWRVDRAEPGSSWSTPLVWRNTAQTEVLFSGGKLLTSHDPHTGRELWRVKGIDVPGASSLAADDVNVYFGYRSPFATGPLYALAAGASGDQSPSANTSDIACQRWTAPGSAPGMPSPLAVGGFVYTLNNNVLCCHEALTGKPLYRQRVRGLGSVAASPLAIEQRVLLLDEAGNAVLLALGPEYKELGRGKLSDTFWASPAAAGDSLLLRGVDHLYCIRSKN